MPVYLKDTFTAGDGTAIEGRTLEVGSTTWTKYLRGTDFTEADIQSGRARLLHAGGGSNGCFAAPAGVSDETVYLSLEATNGNIVPSIVGRLSDVNNWWSLDIYSIGNAVRIIKCEANSTSLEASASVTINDDEQYDMVAVFSGTSIQATVDLVTASTTSSFNQSATRFGFGSLNGAANQTGYFDTFQMGIDDSNPADGLIGSGIGPSRVGGGGGLRYGRLAGGSIGRGLFIK